MKKSFFLISLIAGLTAHAQLINPEVNGGVRVLDETGIPITNAQVSVWFDLLATTNPWDGKKSVAISGLSDTNGLFTTIHSTLGQFGVKVVKEGYYISRSEVTLDKHKYGKWIPWRQVIELKLRKKEAPTPMYAKRLYGTLLPSTTYPVGYDLIVGDWVAPFGKGLIDDVIFTLEREYQSNLNYSWKLAIQTPREGNGFSPILPEQESPQSELHFPKIAPSEGYSSNQIIVGLKYAKGITEITNTASATNFFFRVRTELDEHKRVRQALYGKLIGPIKVQVHYVKTGKLSLTYYVNPDSNSRNLEFDPKKNLFKGLQYKEGEEVRSP